MSISLSPLFFEKSYEGDEGNVLRFEMDKDTLSQVQTEVHAIQDAINRVS